MAELKRLEFAKRDLEPPKPEPIELELGDMVYTARCPNYYEFIQAAQILAKLEDDPDLTQIAVLLETFFDRRDAKLIDRHSRGSDATIPLLDELLPALEALVDHYRPQIEANFKEINKRMKRPKGQR